MNTEYDAWIGKSESSRDRVSTAPMAAMAATLDKSDCHFSEGDPLPPLWHWLYFLNPAPQSGLAEDGHAEKGDFLPPIPLPRRMWAGSRLEFHHPLHAGAEIERHSTIKTIAFKQGRSGNLAFVCVQHEISDGDGLAVSEEHDIVYRDHSPANARADSPRAAPERRDFERQFKADAVLLFRYSALTFNGHRIHYDRDYVRDVEGYPGLVVHGPLLATLLMDLLATRHPQRHIRRFEFRAMRPVFDLNPFRLCGLDPDQSAESQLWIQDKEDALCMKASAVLE